MSDNLPPSPEDQSPENKLPTHQTPPVSPVDENLPAVTKEAIMPERQKVEGEYGAGQMHYLSDLEHVRQRYGMYVGDNEVKGLHHLVSEVVDNSIDEAMAGHANEIFVTINVEGSITVSDDGRGIPVDIHPGLSEKEGREISSLEGVMTVLKFGGKFDKQAYKTSGGLHGMGVKAVNFLSEWCEVEVYREGHVWQQDYSRGKPTSPIRRLGVSNRTGTKTTFKPDPNVFTTVKFEYSVLQKRLQELAFLNRGVKINLKDDRSGETDTFQYERGLVAFIEHQNRASEVVHGDILHMIASQGDVEMEIAVQYASEYTENVHSYVNNINTVMGGFHVSGFRSALTRTLKQYGKTNNLFKDIEPESDDFKEGLTAVISVRLPEPRFESQTKVRCLNNELEGIVNSTFGQFLAKFLEENPRTAKSIVQKAQLAAEARVAARNVKNLLRERKGALSGGGLPGKLRDCSSKKIEECELYLVEGDSAGGSAEGGRFREFQAILPLRGKIINAYKSREDKVLANEEVRSMISAIGVGIGEDADLTKRRYNKIVIMTDADVDGSHIRTLLLTFFYRQMYLLIEAGHIYVAQPPLFRVKSKKDVYYVQTEEEMKSRLLSLGLGDSIFEPGDGRAIAGDEMTRLARTLADVEDSLVALERRGINLKEHALRRDEASGELPVFHVYVGTHDQWFYNREQVDAFLKSQEEATGGEMEVSDDSTPADKRLHIVELYEVRTINKGLKELAALGFDIQSLIPQERTGRQDSRYHLRRGESSMGLEDLRGLPAAIRSIGEKGLQITRFKGLGEMNAEELRDTTLDRTKRTLSQIRMDDAAEADNMFRILMGDKVEPRREFIEKHALDVRNLDV